MKPIDQHIIEQYLLGHLEGPELLQFEEQMKTNPELAKEVKIQEALLQQITDLGHQRMRKKLERIKEEVISTPNPKVKEQSTLFKKWWFLALLALLLGIAVYCLLQSDPTNTSPSPTRIYAQHFEAYKIPFSSRNLNDNQDLIAAGNFYQNGEYDKALPIFLSLEQDSDFNDEKADLAIGICQMEMGQFKQAIQRFGDIQKNQQHLYYEQAMWYQALSLIHQDKLPKAQSILQNIASNPNHFFQEKATTLLSQLN